MTRPEQDGRAKGTGGRRRRAAAWLGGGLAAAALVVGLAAYFLPVIARPVVRSVVAGLNVGEVAFTIGHIGWREAQVTGIALGDPQGDEPFASIGDARITYNPFDLLNGKADSLTLDGVQIRVRWRDGALDAGAMQPLLERAGDGEETGPPPLDRVTLNGARIDLETPDGLVGMSLDGDVVLAGAAGGMTADLDVGVSGEVLTGSAALRGSAAAGALAVDLSDLVLETHHNLVDGTLTLEDGTAAVSMESGGVVSARIDGGVTYAPAGIRDVSSVSGPLSLSAEFDPAVQRGELRLEQCVPVALALNDAARFRVENVRLCAPQDAPLAVLDMSGDTADIRAAALVPPVRFAVANMARGTAPAVSVQAVLAGGAPLEVAVKLNGGDIDLPGQRIGLRGFAGQLALRAADAASGDQPARLTVEAVSVRDLSAAPRFAPVRASAVLTLDTAGTLRGPVRVMTPKGTGLATGQVRHVLSTGRGQLRFSTGTLTFSKNGLQPHLLAPVLSGVVAAVSGDVAVTGNIAWTTGGVVSSGAELVIANLGLQASAARFDGIAGTITFSSLLPVRTDGAQRITIGVLDAGVPLAGGEARVDVRDNGDVVIENAQWPFAGGQLVLTSGVLNTAADVQRAELSAVQVDLKQLLTMIDLAGLTGEGELQGAVPIEIRNGSVFVTSAVLSAKPGGVIRYSSAGTDAAGKTAEGANIAFQALENFHFEVLSVEIDGPVDGDLTVKVVLRGANPDLLEGYPVHMNITTQGAFMDLVRRGTVGFRALDIVSGKEETGDFNIERVGPEPVE